MSKKRILLKNVKALERKTTLKKVLRLYSLILLVLVLCFGIGSIIYGFIIARPSGQTVCIKSESDAKDKVSSLPEVKKYLKKLSRDQLSSYVDVEMPVVIGSETKVGHAYVGEKTENNSKTLFNSYAFVTGCGSKIQRQNKIDPETYEGPYRPIFFDYINQMAYKTYTDETKYCFKDISKLYRVDFDKDGQQEYLRGCVTGGDANEIKYYVYKNNNGKIDLLDSLTSSGAFDEIADFNKDGCPDIAISQILMDIGGCKGDDCYVSLGKDPLSGKILLKQSFHYLWDPGKNRFGQAEKAEVYYIKNGTKTIVN